MNYLKNYFGKNIVSDPAFVFKRASWGALSSRLGLPIGLTFVWYIIAFVIIGAIEFVTILIMGSVLGSFLGSGFNNIYNIISDPVYYLTSLSIGFLFVTVLSSVLMLAATIFLSSIITYGLANLAVRYKREKSASFGDGFAAFSNFGRVFSTVALQVLLVVAWGLVPLVGPILAFIAYYRYRFALYILIDDPDIPAIEAIRESKRLMYGNKGQLFVQEASMLGWVLGFAAILFLISALFSLLLGLLGIIFATILCFILGVAFAAAWSMYREIAAVGFYDQARAGSSSRDSANMDREGAIGSRQGDTRPSIEALAGAYRGATFRFEPDEQVVIGRDAGLSDIIFDQEAEKISRKHISVLYSSQEQVYIVHDFSSNGTFTDDGKQLPTNVDSRLPRGSVLVLGSRANTIRLD